MSIFLSNYFVILFFCSDFIQDRGSQSVQIEQKLQEVTGQTSGGAGEHPPQEFRV